MARIENYSPHLRNSLAAERSLLAALRMNLTMMGVGLGVRFHLESDAALPTAAGLIVAGVLVQVHGIWRYERDIRHIQNVDLPVSGRGQRLSRFIDRVTGRRRNP